MIPFVPGLLALGLLHVMLAALAHSPRLMCGLAVAGCALPFLVPTTEPLWRCVAAVLAITLVLKAVLVATGRVKPRTRFDLLLFLISWMPVVRWETPLHPDLRRAARALVTALFQIGLVVLLIVAVRRADLHSPVWLVAAQIGLYLGAAALGNLSLVKFGVRGLDYEDTFNNPFGSRTPAEFWGRRWNVPISQLLHRYVFLPVGGRRYPARGIMASFGASAVLHEVVFDFATLKFNGGMLAYFTLQGGLVVATSRSRLVRRFARDTPRLAWFLTTIVMLVTGIIFVRGMDGVDPSNAWQRVWGAK